MHLGLRTMVTILLAGTAPLALAGYSALRLADEALTRRVSDLHVTVARLLADRIGDEVRRDLFSVQLAAAAFDLETLTAEERFEALQLVFRQIERASALALLDPDGSLAAPVVRLTVASEDPALAGRPPLSAEDLEAFTAAIPYETAWEAGKAIGAPYVAPGGTGPRLAIAVRAASGAYVFAVEIDQQYLVEAIGRPRLGGLGRAFVVDGEGRVILDVESAAMVAREDRWSWDPVRRAVVGANEPVQYEDPILGEAIGAGARIPELGWAVIAAEPLSEAIAASNALRRRVGGWLLVAFFAAALLGLVSTRTILRPIRAISQGAAALAQGDFDHRVAGAERTDELGELARAFNEMAAEIGRWNRELEGRVEDQRRELREAQALLLRSQKLAAVGQLGAGVAHEVNNPLAAILGLAQLLAVQEIPGTQTRERLDQIQEMARRIREIVGNLQRLSEAEAELHLRGTDIRRILDGALSCMADELEDDGITVVRDYAADLPQVAADPARLTEAVLHLMQNARNAMTGGGHITLSAHSDGKTVFVAVTDDGEGMDAQIQSKIFDPFFTTKRRDWQSKGLGLALVNKIVEGHGGTIKVVSTPGEGTTFTITLPAHLERSVA
jgi:two-component system, NtrC family, sensor kinase